MGTKILVPDADFSDVAVGFDAAITENLLGLWFFNRGVRHSRRNLALGGIDADVIGTPEDEGAFLRFKGGQSFFQTHIPDSTELTLIVAGKSPDTLADSGHSPMFISNFGSRSKSGYLDSANSGVSIYSNADGSNATMAASRYTNVTESAVSSWGAAQAAVISGWSLLSMRTRQNRTQRENHTVAGASAVNHTDQNRVLAAGDLRIGSSYNSLWTGIADVAAVAVYDSYISDGDLATTVGQIRNVLDFLGITV